MTTRHQPIEGNRQTTGQPSPPHEPIGDEQSSLRPERDVLIGALEEKARLLEQSNHALQQELARHQQIADQLRTQSAVLRASEERLRTIFDSDPECVKVLAADGSLKEMNRAGLRMIEADSFEQVADQCLTRLVVPEHRVAFEELMERVFRGESGTLEFEVIGLKGARLWLETHASPLHDDHGTVIAMLGITRNITDRKRAEAALRASEQRFATVFRASPVGICITTVEEGTFLDVNEAFLKIVGHQRDEVLGRTSLEIGYWLDPQDRHKLVQALKETGSVSNWEVEFRHKDGSVGHSLRSLERITVDHQDCILTLVHDITERKQAEASVTGQKQILEKIALGVPLPESLCDLLRLLEAQSPDMICSVLLLDADGVHLRHGAGPSLRDEFNRAIDGVVIGPNVGSCGTAVFRREQVIVADIATDPLWADFRDLALAHGLRACWSTPIFDAAGHVLGTFAIYYRHPGLPTAQHRRLIDIATHVATIAIGKNRAEAALCENEERLRLTTIGSNTGLWDRDLRTNQVHFSTIWKRQIGYEDHEISNAFDEWQSRVHPDDIERSLATVAAYLANPWPEYECEFRLRHKDGSYRWILAKGSLQRDSHGEPIRMLGSHIDVSERRRMEDELRDGRQRLEALSRQLITTQEAERRHLARELHDEIGQALTAIKLNLKTLQQPAQAATRGSLVQETIAVVDQTLNQVRSLALDLRPSMLDDIGLVAALRWCLDRQTRRAGFAAQFLAEPPEVTTTSEIATTCFRVAQESLTNIARHAQATSVRVEIHQQGTELELIVTDNGIGFDVTAARARAVAGASIGLLGMSERVELIGGNLDILSIPDGGTTIRARFPLGFGVQ